MGEYAFEFIAKYNDILTIVKVQYSWEEIVS